MLAAHHKEKNRTGFKRRRMQALCIEEVAAYIPNHIPLPEAGMDPRKLAAQLLDEIRSDSNYGIATFYDSKKFPKVLNDVRAVMNQRFNLTLPDLTVDSEYKFLTFKKKA